MGYWKNLSIEMDENPQRARLAEALGISFLEIRNLDYSIENHSSKDGLIYGYDVEFDEETPPEILKKMKRLDNNRSVYFDAWELDDNYDRNEEFEAITENKEYVEKFRAEMINIKALSSHEIPDESLRKIFHRQLFISVIGAMETFLGDALINLTFEDEAYFRNFIEKTNLEHFRRKLELREIFNEKDNLNETAKKVMLDNIMYHNLPAVSNIYHHTFEIEFPPIDTIYAYVRQRHDLVHRNGKTKEGEPIELDEDAIAALIVDMTEFVDAIAEKLNLH